MSVFYMYFSNMNLVYYYSTIYTFMFDIIVLVFSYFIFVIYLTMLCQHHILYLITIQSIWKCFVSRLK